MPTLLVTRLPHSFSNILVPLYKRHTPPRCTRMCVCSLSRFSRKWLSLFRRPRAIRLSSLSFSCSPACTSLSSPLSSSPLASTPHPLHWRRQQLSLRASSRLRAPASKPPPPSLSLQPPSSRLAAPRLHRLDLRRDLFSLTPRHPRASSSPRHRLSGRLSCGTSHPSASATR